MSLTFETDLKTYLSAYSGLTALVGTRVYPADELPQDVVYPAATYQRISGPRLHVASYVKARYQFTCWGQTVGTTHGHDTARRVADQIRAALEGIHTDMGTTHVHSIVLNDMDGDSNQTLGLYSVLVDARIMYQETTP